MNQEEKYTILPQTVIYWFSYMTFCFQEEKIKQLQSNDCTHTLYNPVLNDNFPEEAAEASHYTDYTKVYIIIFKPRWLRVHST